MCVTFHVSERLLSEIFINLKKIQFGLIINLRKSPYKMPLNFVRF